MWRLIFLIIMFLVIVYVYTFLKIRKRKKQKQTELSFVEQYHANFEKYSSSARSRRKSTNEPTNFVTKYNSSVDYIER